jgi:putative addiction module component (TIGR02574 family)
LRPRGEDQRALVHRVSCLKSHSQRRTTLPINLEAFGIDTLSVRERLDLIEQIWDSLPEQVNPDEVPAWHLAELARRRAEVEVSPRAGRPWREALARFGNES